MPGEHGLHEVELKSSKQSESEQAQLGKRHSPASLLEGSLRALGALALADLVRVRARIALVACAQQKAIERRLVSRHDDADNTDDAHSELPVCAA